MLPLTFATPGVAQSTADMGRQSAPYGPPQAAQEKGSQRSVRNHSYLLSGAETVKPANNGPRIIAGTQLSPDAILGVGMFKASEAGRPFSAPRDQPNNSRIAAVGLAVKF
jgi:hypothetical protein